MTMKVTKDNVGKVLASIQELVGRQVLVGIPATKVERNNDEQADPINNAQLGYIHEFGSPKANIPGRPSLIPGVAAQEESIANHLKKAVQAAIKGDDEKVELELNAAGLIGQAGVRREINDGDHAALSEATIAQRLKRGRTGTKPLIDTGQLRNSITYVIRERD